MSGFGSVQKRKVFRTMRMQIRYELFITNVKKKGFEVCLEAL